MVTYMALYRILEYEDIAGRGPFKDWFGSLEAQAAAKISVALARLAQGNASDRHDLVILLGGGTKRRQQPDIEAALDRWTDYKRRKKEAR